MSESKETDRNSLPERFALRSLRSAIEKLEATEKQLIEVNTHEELRNSMETAWGSRDSIQKDFSTALSLLREALKELPEGDLKNKIDNQVDYIWERRN